MANRSCGTCRDRRILCDRTLPLCSRCSQSNRTCKGYGVRLSWPKANDKRRAVVARSSLQQNTGHRFSNARLVNISTWDIEMHRHLSGAMDDMNDCRVPPADTTTTNAMESIQTGCRRKGFISILLARNELCIQLPLELTCTASCSLATFGHDPTDVGNMLISLALVNNTPSAAAMLRSFLAFSSLHRSGLQTQAAELKIGALKALGAASNREIGTMEKIQHIAAGMLLCSFEIHQASCTSGQWRSYIIGVKSIIKSFPFDMLKRDSSFNTLLDWVYYHDTLSRFSLTHWHQPAIEMPLEEWDEPVDIPSPQVDNDPCLEIAYLTQSPFTTTLGILTEICDLVGTIPSHTLYKTSDSFKSYLQILAWRVRSIPISHNTVDGSPGMTALMELFQLATLVYLSRVSGNLLEPATDTEQRIQRAFVIFSQLTSCERQFPLLILGCEARTDEERCTVLDLISRTEKGASSRSLFLTKKLIQAIWVQEDLSQGQVNYTDKLSAILSCCTILPTFV